MRRRPGLQGNATLTMSARSAGAVRSRLTSSSRIEFLS